MKKKISGIHHKTFFAVCLNFNNPGLETALFHAVMVFCFVFSSQHFSSLMQLVFILGPQKNKYDICEIKSFSIIMVV